jgi:predicted  nucleic acid-binding Zn-ribbon protein
MLNEALKQIGQVQKIDLAILQLQKRFSMIDPGSKTAAGLVEAKANLDAADAAHKAIRTEIEDLELQTKSFEQKMESEKKRLYSGGVYNAKDADNIDREIANLTERRSKADDRILELWEQIDPAKEFVDKARALYSEAESRANEYAAKYNEAKSEAEAKLAQLMGMRAVEAEKCDPALLQKYDAMRQKRGGIGLAVVVDDTCSACQTRVPEKQLGDIKEGHVLQTCENCKRYLYVDEQA